MHLSLVFGQKRVYPKCPDAGWLALPTSDHEAPASKPAGGEIQLITMALIAEPFITILLSSWYDSNKR